MPWIGVTADGGRVIPEEVPDGEYVSCPNCEEEMYPRGPTVDGKARHFVHRNRFSGCSGGRGGESDRHRKWKSMVLSALRQWFPEHIAESRPEATLDVRRTTSPVKNRRADVYVEFDSEHPVLGDHLVVEVQHANRGKARESVNHDYVVLGASVYWADESDFSDDRFRLHRMIEAFRTEQTEEWTAIVGPETSALAFDPVPELESPNPEPTTDSSANSVTDWDEFEGMQYMPEDVGVPVRDDDGHVVPAIPDCNHDYPIVRRGNRDEFRCKHCGVVFKRVGGPRDGEVHVNERNHSLSSSYLRAVNRLDKLEPGDRHHIPDCDDRSWIRDDENDVYRCVICGKEYPQDVDSRREQVSSS